MEPVLDHEVEVPSGHAAGSPHPLGPRAGRQRERSEVLADGGSVRNVTTPCNRGFDALLGALTDP